MYYDKIKKNNRVEEEEKTLVPCIFCIKTGKDPIHLLAVYNHAFHKELKFDTVTVYTRILLRS